MIDTVSLEDGVLALHGALLISWREDVSLLTPFHLVCLEVCQIFVNLITLNLNVSDPKISQSMGSIHVNWLQCFWLFHALSTFVNFICWLVKTVNFEGLPGHSISVPSKLGEDTKERCLSCVARAVRDLYKHKAHLETLGQSESALLQRYITVYCLMMFFDWLCAIGVLKYGGNICNCIRHGSNRTSSRLDDIVGIKIGKDALGHFASLGEPLLEAVSPRQGLRVDPILQDLSDRYGDLERYFWTAMNTLDVAKY